VPRHVAPDVTEAIAPLDTVVDMALPPADAINTPPLVSWLALATPPDDDEI